MRTCHYLLADSYVIDNVLCQTTTRYLRLLGCRQARTPVAGLEPAIEESLQISGQTRWLLRHRSFGGRWDLGLYYLGHLSSGQRPRLDYICKDLTVTRFRTKRSTLLDFNQGAEAISYR
ncbi:hypothetical protein PoB_001666800 [Plakobranchus ocellatus]|uniref:Uncharacterized protein n=1 Tax=Plakobranchus ocellatus TaxID=259542 RepID=A0AAV3Z6D3_9GAST|nr:hypothetical protein PoB_001666800 [Plakobranchus ocellatus]